MSRTVSFFCNATRSYIPQIRSSTTMCVARTTPGAGGSAVPEIQEAVAKGEQLPGARLRARLREGWNRSSHHQAEASLDQRPGRADEPNHQGRYREGVPLRGPGQPQSPRPRLRRRLAIGKLA